MKKPIPFLSGMMKSRSRLSSKIDKVLVRLHKSHENLDYDFESNGEFEMLRRLSVLPEIRTLFDVGANVGEWSLAASALFPQARIEAFEIVPRTYDDLLERCKQRDNISCHNTGLSDTAGTTTVYCSPEQSAIATCVGGFSEQFHRYEPQRIKAEVSTGDDLCAQLGIETIDFLKIDVEGYEHRVLAGFAQMLKEGRIKLIQFEYGYVNVDTHFLLKDFYELLEGFGMEIGKIYPSYVDLRKYRYSSEDFYGPNYLAVHSSCRAARDLVVAH